MKYCKQLETKLYMSKRSIMKNLQDWKILYHVTNQLVHSMGYCKQAKCNEKVASTAEKLKHYTNELVHSIKYFEQAKLNEKKLQVASEEVWTRCKQVCRKLNKWSKSAKSLLKKIVQYVTMNKPSQCIVWMRWTVKMLNYSMNKRSFVNSCKIFSRKNSMNKPVCSMKYCINSRKTSQA